MSDLHQARIVVVGAGAFGLAVASTAARAGARVVLIAPADATTSEIAAGMLAPAFECLLDPASAGHFSLLAASRDLWLAACEALPPIGLVRCGALMKASPERAAALSAELQAMGAIAETGEDFVFTPDDWRLEPRLALDALAADLSAHGGAWMDGVAVGVEGRQATLGDGQVIEADAIVLASGYGGLHLAPELAAIRPIKGQLLRYAGAGRDDGPILRGDGYLVPSSAGAVVGATMAQGETGLGPDPKATAHLLKLAEAFDPTLAGVCPTVQVGIRPASPDGLPMIGQSKNGAWIANGARRNGWLLAPLAARLISEGLAGARPDLRFDPGRFSVQGENPPAH